MYIILKVEQYIIYLWDIWSTNMIYVRYQIKADTIIPAYMEKDKKWETDNEITP